MTAVARGAAVDKRRLTVDVAANSFGQTHLPEIRQASDLIAGIVRKAQGDGSLRDAVAQECAALASYGAIEQVLTGWIFGLLEQGEEADERAKRSVVETICGGLDARSDRGPA